MRKQINKDECGLIVEKKCPICGRNVVIHSLDDYVYKLTVKGTKKYYCSWTCHRKAEKEIETGDLRWRRRI